MSQMSYQQFTKMYLEWYKQRATVYFSITGRSMKDIKQMTLNDEDVTAIINSVVPEEWHSRNEPAYKDYELFHEANFHVGKSKYLEQYQQLRQE